MKIIIESEPKEIAELLSALQAQERDAAKSGVTKVIGYTYTPPCPRKCCERLKASSDGSYWTSAPIAYGSSIGAVTHNSQEAH